MATKCPKCHSDNPDAQPFCGKCGTKLGTKAQVSVTRTLETTPEGLGKGELFAGRFELIEELGAGGMGKVYRAYDKEVGEEIALKVLHPEIALDERTVDRFRNEIKLARRITHKNVCRMHELHQDGKQLFITMEYVPGQDLKGFIEDSGPLSTGKAVSIAKQVAEGLAEAHDLGVIHRDLKPQNIMVDKDGLAKIMDFGIARSLRSAGMTAEGVIIGTPEYMAPEQVEGLEADQRTDIYALGAILFEMVTRRVPFEGDTPLSVAYKHKNEPPIPPRNLNALVPEPLNQLILRCLEKDKENRYQTADELLADLVRIEDGLPISERVILKARPTIRISREKPTGLRRFLTPVLVLIVLSVAAAIVWRLVLHKAVRYPPPIENSIAVISFENQSGDPTDDFLRKSIPNLLITNLENSGLFDYVPTRERVRDLLKQIGKKDIELIDTDSDFEACRREGIEAIVLGSFIKAGETYVIDVKIQDVETKQLLMSANSRGEGQESILRTQIDELSRKIVEGMGIAKQKIASSQMAKSIVDVTTSSIEAYNYYLRGVEELDKHYWDDARQLLEKAVEKDPQFAAAYNKLASVYRSSGWGDAKAYDEAMEKAKKFAQNAPDKERLYIEAQYVRGRNWEEYFLLMKQLSEQYPKDKLFHFELGRYYRVHENDTEKAIEEYSRALGLDPDYGPALNELGFLYLRKSEFEKALELYQRYAKANPEEANPLDNLASVYYEMGDLDQAIEKFNEALALKPDFFISAIQIPYVYALKEDYRGAVNRLEHYISVAESSTHKAWALMYQAFFDYWLGRTAYALKKWQTVENNANEEGDEGTASRIDSLRSWTYYDRGDKEACREHLKSWVDYINSREKLYPLDAKVEKGFCSFILALTGLKEGLVDSAKSMLKEIDALMIGTDMPNLGRFHSRLEYYRNYLQAEILLKEGSPEDAIVEFHKTPGLSSPTLQGFAAMITYNFPPLKDILARAYQQKGDLDKAIAEYERLIKFDPKSTSRFLIHPKYYHRLAKHYEEKGNKKKARANYQRFLELWKDADPGTPEVEDAKARLTALK